MILNGNTVSIIVSKVYIENGSIFKRATTK